LASCVKRIDGRKQQNMPLRRGTTPAPREGPPAKKVSSRKSWCRPGSWNIFCKKGRDLTCMGKEWRRPSKKDPDPSPFAVRVGATGGVGGGKKTPKALFSLGGGGLGPKPRPFESGGSTRTRGKKTKERLWRPFGKKSHEGRWEKWGHARPGGNSKKKSESEPVYNRSTMAAEGERPLAGGKKGGAVGHEIGRKKDEQGIRKQAKRRNNSYVQTRPPPRKTR